MGSIPEDDRGARFSLGSSAREGQPQYRDFAELLLGYLHGSGLPEIDKLHRAPEGNTAAPDLRADAGPYDPDLRRVTLENGQIVYVHLNAGRSRHGHKEIDVLTRQQAEERLIASRAERAIVAATTAMEYVPIETHRLRRALNQIDGPITKSANEHSSETAQKMLRIERSSRDPQRRRENAQRAVEFQANLQTSSLEYVLALLRYSRPRFDDLPRDEQVGLILVASEYLNGFLESLRKLMAFLEYGASEGGLPTNTVKNLNRDVQATLLSELTDLSHRTIGKELDIPPPPSSEIKGGHATVRNMIKRGRSFLIGLLGDDGWQEHLTRMKTDARRYQTLSKEERIVEDLAEYWSESKEEARERLERRRRQFEDVPSSLSCIPEEQLLDHLRNLDQEPPT
jgi:hypothetical protein